MCEEKELKKSVPRVSLLLLVKTANEKCNMKPIAKKVVIFCVDVREGKKETEGTWEGKNTRKKNQSHVSLLINSRIKECNMKAKVRKVIIFCDDVRDGRKEME